MQEALIILNACDQNIFRGYIADITLLNIDYIASKQSKEIKEFLKIINKSFSVIGADNELFTLALDIDNNDLEDNIQYFCAKVSACDVIVTNDKKFYKGDMKVVSSQAFVDQYI
jgi:predicted nucleic acid-binding protein